MSTPVSTLRRRQVVDALRHGAVPDAGLGLLAVGLDRYAKPLDEEVATVTAGGSVFKAVRGEYGSGKTFFTRWLAERARVSGLATTEVQISENETPLHRLETVYRRLTERLTTSTFPPSAMKQVVDTWLYALEDDVITRGDIEPDDLAALTTAVNVLLDQRLASVARSTPAFAAALRGYRTASIAGDTATAEAILAWLGGQPHVAAAARRAAGVRGDLDHTAALGFLQGLLNVLRDAGHPGLLLVLDEVETLQRVRSDARDKALNALRQLIDDIYTGRFPGLYLVITGTPAFYDGTQGAQRLPPLAQRLATDLGTDPRFDNPRAVQLRLPGFTHTSLVELGGKVRDLYTDGHPDSDRIRATVDDAYIDVFANAVAGQLGGNVGIAPRIFLKKLVADVLDRVDQYPDFDPRRHYQLTLAVSELTDVEANAAGLTVRSVDDIDLTLP